MMNTPIQTFFLFLVFSFLIFSHALFSQGIVRGRVIDDDRGEPLIGVTVFIEGTTTGAVTDFDGNFHLSLPSGTYDLRFTYVSFESLLLSRMVIEDGKVHVVGDVRMKEDTEILEEVVITADLIKTTESALLTVKRKSANLIDGISSTSFRKIGDSDAASAMKRITGVSIEGGKYVYVRGLGDRYTKTLLNGVDIPGLDPDRNSLQMDIFPTNVLNNIIAMKSFVAELPADFTGGLINIETIDFPNQKTFNVSLGLGYNPVMHFNDHYVNYQGGRTDFLGFDDGTRSLHIEEDDFVVDIRNTPQQGNTLTPGSSDGTKYADQLRGFNNTLAARRDRSLFDYNFNVSLSNQKNTSIGDLGYNFAGSYRNSTEFYPGATYSRYGIASDPDVHELELREFQEGDFGTHDVLLGGLAGVAFKRKNAQYKVNVLHLQNGQSKAGIFTFIGSDEGADFTTTQHNLSYSQKRLTHFLIGGEHYFDHTPWNIDWKMSASISDVADPDVRFTRYELIGDGTAFSITSEGGFPERIWRELDEKNGVGILNATREYRCFGQHAQLKLGTRQTWKERDYSIKRFQFVVDPDVTLTGNPDELMAEENLWPRNGERSLGNYFTIPFLPINSNVYNAEITNSAFYISNEFKPWKKLKTIVGVRTEYYQQVYTGANQGGSIILDDRKVIKEFNFYPSINLVYEIKERQNLRFSYTRTTARFSFKEASFSEIFDPLTGRTFIGGLNQDEDFTKGIVYWDGDIQSTLIDNLDLRWEIFMKNGQTLSFSTFYKNFIDVIEMVQFAKADNNFQPRNVGNASVFGIEFECRTHVDFLSPSLKNFTLNGNFTLLESRIDMSQTEFESRVRNARTGQSVKNYRSLQGQSPYIINLGLGYANEKNGLEAGLYYNVQGETLLFTGIADKPDIFSVPFNGLNFNVNKSFGVNQKFRAGIKIANILNAANKQIYRNYQAKDQVFQNLAPSTKFTVRVRYAIGH